MAVSCPTKHKYELDGGTSTILTQPEAKHDHFILLVARLKIEKDKRTADIVAMSYRFESANQLSIRDGKDFHQFNQSLRLVRN